jgi:hypothetical protein
LLLFFIPIKKGKRKRHTQFSCLLQGWVVYSSIQNKHFFFAKELSSLFQHAVDVFPLTLSCSITGSYHVPGGWASTFTIHCCVGSDFLRTHKKRNCLVLFYLIRIDCIWNVWV